jgi:hypothetical protein
MNLKISTVAFTLAKAAEILYCHREKLPYKKVSGMKNRTEKKNESRYGRRIRK